MKRGSASSSGTLLAEGLTESNLYEVDAHRMADEVRHLAAGDAGGDLDDGNAAIGRRDQLRERDRVAQAERTHRFDRDALGESELLVGDRRRVHVYPADAEADSGWPEPVGERHEDGLTAAGDDDPVHLDPARRTPPGSLRASAIR